MEKTYLILANWKNIPRPISSTCSSRWEETLEKDPNREITDSTREPHLAWEKCFIETGKQQEFIIANLYNIENEITEELDKRDFVWKSESSKRTVNG